MLSTLNEDLKPFEDLAASFAAKELASGREENDHYPFGPFWDNVIAHAGAVGLFSATLPEDLGGIGQGMGALCLMLDHLSRMDASLAGIIFTNTFAQELMIATGTPAPLGTALEQAANARQALIAGPVFNDPAEIPDLANARRTDTGYLLSGTVDYVVLGGIAGHALVPGRTDTPDDYGIFLVNLDDPRVSPSDPVVSLGLRACPAVDLTFDDAPALCIAPAGKELFKAVCDRMHVAAAAILTGIMKGCLAEALEYAQERSQGGREIIGWSEMQMILGRMGILTQNADMILDRACLAVDNKEPAWQLSSRAAASHIGELACELTTDGIQVLGGYGYMHDYGQEKRFRDAKHVQSLMGITARKKISYLKELVA